jgi:hypothetical protein
LSELKILKITPDKFHKNIIEFYCKNVEKNTNDTIITAKNFVEFLPDLKLIREIIKANNITKKELFTFKIILDIYEHFYKKFDGPLYDNLLFEYLPTATFFYSNLSEDNVKYLYDCLSALTNREVYDSLLIKLKAVINKKKSCYLKHMDNLKKMLICFVGDLDKNKILK